MFPHMSATLILENCRDLASRVRWLFAALLISLSVVCDAAGDQESPDTPQPFVTPAQPEPGQEIYAGLFYPIGGCADGTYSVERNGDVILVTHFIPIPGTPIDLGTCFLTVPIGALPTGAYVLEWSEQLIPDVFLPGVQYLYTYHHPFVVGTVLPVISAQPIPTLSWLGLSGLIAIVAGLAFFIVGSKLRNQGECFR